MPDPTAPPPSDRDLAAGREQLAAAEAAMRSIMRISEGNENPVREVFGPLLAEYDRRGDQVRVQEIAFQGQAATESYLRADLAQARDRIAALETVAAAARKLERPMGDWQPGWDALWEALGALDPEVTPDV